MLSTLPTQILLQFQTDLTIMDVTALENNYQKKTCELAETHAAKGYPYEEDLNPSFLYWF